MNLLDIVPIRLRSLAGKFLHPIPRIITNSKTFKEAWNTDIMLEIYENTVKHKSFLTLFTFFIFLEKSLNISLSG